MKGRVEPYSIESVICRLLIIPRSLFGGGQMMARGLLDLKAFGE